MSRLALIRANDKFKHPIKCPTFGNFSEKIQNLSNGEQDDDYVFSTSLIFIQKKEMKVIILSVTHTRARLHDNYFEAMLPT